MPTVKVKGMTCQHCVKSVTEAVDKVEGTQNVNVNLDAGTATWDETAPVDVAAVKAAIDAVGFDVE